MNTPNPLLPQGALPEHRGKSHFRVAVFTILAVHVVVLGGLLVQGCKKEAAQPQVASETNTYPRFAEATNVPSIFNDPGTGTGAGLTLPPRPGARLTDPPSDAAAGWSNQPPIPGPSSFATAPQDFTAADPTPIPSDLGLTGSNVEHTVIRGDTFGGLAKKYRVSASAIQAANPGVVPTRLKIGQRLVIPVGDRLAQAPQNGTSANLAASGNGKVHVVKSGDTLGRIAKANRTTVNAIRDLNNLRSDQIRVGQKLKIPSSGGAAAAPTDNP